MSGNIKRPGRRLKLIALSTACTLVPAHAYCQSAAPPPPVRPNIDQRSVSLTTGQLIAGAVDISIGPDDHRGLKFVRQWTPNQWRQAIVPTISGSSDNPLVTYDGKSYRFEWNSSYTGYIPSTQDGSSLSTDLSKFTLSDGTVVNFGLEGIPLQYYQSLDNMGLGQNIVYPDGTKTSFHYKFGQYVPCQGCGGYTVARLSSVTNSIGYQLKLEYYSNTTNGVNTFEPWARLTKVTAINNAVEYCDPSADSCSTSLAPFASYTYTNGKISSVTDASGRVTNYSFDNNRLSGVRFPGASVNTIEIGYGADQKVSTVKNAGQVWTYQYAIGQTSVVSSGNHSRSINFDPETMLVSASIDENGHQTSYAYCTTEANCPTGLLRQRTMPEGNAVSYEYDARGNVSKITAIPKPGSGASPFILSQASYPLTCTNQKVCNQPATTTDPAGQVTDYEYDSSSGMVSRVTAPAPAVGQARPETRTTFFNLQAWVKNASGGLELAPSATRYVDKISTCASGSAPACLGTPAETVQEFIYEGAGSNRGTNVLLGTIITRSGNSDPAQRRTVSLTYEDSGDLKTLSDGAGNVTQMRYNAARQLVSAWSPDPDGAAPQRPQAQMIQYGAYGLPEIISYGTIDTGGTNFTPISNRILSYDGYGRQIMERVQANGTDQSLTQTSYDLLGRSDCVALRMNPAVFGSLPTSACSLGTTGVNGPDRITKNEYDAAGQLKKVIRAYGVTTANGFPATLQQDYAAYTFSNNGRPKTVKDANGNRAEMFYDGFDRQIAWAFPSKGNGASTASCTVSGVSEINGISGPTEARNASDDCEKYAYDRNGNRAKLMKRDGQVIRYSYDALNRMTVKDLPLGSDVYYGYDLRGLQTYARFGSPNGEGITNVWDGLGRLTSNTTNMGGVSRKLSYEYGSTGNRTKIVFPDEQKDGNGNVTVARHFNYDYDNLDRLLKIRENDTTEIASISYNGRGELTDIGGGFNTHFDYDGISRLARITHNMTSAGQAVTFCMGVMSGETCNPAYNPAGQILKRMISNSAYVWNGHENVNRNYGTNGLNQYTTAGSASLSYDPNGNLTSDGSTTYAYDVENRLTGTSGADNVTLSYDPLGRLYQTVDASRSAPGNTTRFLYDGDKLVAEYDGNNEMVHRYIHGSGTDDPLVWYMGPNLGSRRHLRTDHQGSIVAISNSGGNSIAINSYDEYGVAGLRNLGRFGYTGQIIIPELGLNYYKARIYSPTLGRFLQTDPIGYDDQINLYAYVGNDPVNKVDPSGLSSSDWLCFGDCSGSYWNGDFGSATTSSGFDAQGDPWAVVTGGDKVMGFSSWDWPSQWGDFFGEPQKSEFNCNPPKSAMADAAEIGLNIIAVGGAGMEVVGLFTGNPILAGAGFALNTGATIGLGALHYSRGDLGGLAGDGVGLAINAVPFGAAVRSVGGAKASWGMASNGRLLTNWFGKTQAQNKAYTATAGALAGGADFCQNMTH